MRHRRSLSDLMGRSRESSAIGAPALAAEREKAKGDVAMVSDVVDAEGEWKALEVEVKALVRVGRAA